MTDKNNNVSKRELNDIVLETMILNESMYGCPEVEGKIYGYNPVTKKCVDITDYQGPEKPKAAKSDKFVPYDRDDVVDKEGYDFSLDGLEEMFLDVSNILLNPEEWINCAEKHPVATIGGILLGSAGGFAASYNGIVRTAFKGSKFALKGTAKATFGAFKTAPLLMSAISAGALYFYFSDEKNTALSSVRKTITLGFKVPGITGDQELGAYFFPDLVQAIDDRFKQVDNWVDVHKGNISCGLAAIAGSAATVYMVRKGAAPAMRGLAGVRNLVLGTSLTNRFAYSMSNILKKFTTKTDQVSLFIALKKAGKLDQSIKFATKVVDGKPILKTNKAFTDVVVKLSDLPADVQKVFKKQAKNGKVTLNSLELQRQLADISDDTVADVANRYQKEASQAVKSGPGKDAQRLFKILGRGQSLTPRALQRQFFKETGGLFDDLIRKQGPNIRSLYKDSLDLKKLKSAVNLSDDITDSFVKSGRSAGDFVTDLVADGTVSGRQKEKAIQYFSKLQDFATKEKDLSTRLAQVQRVMDEESAFVKAFGDGTKEGSKKGVLRKQFLQTTDATGLGKFQEEIKIMLPTFSEVLRSSSLQGVLRKTFLLGKVGVLGYVSYEAVGFLQDSQKQISEKIAISSARQFAEKYITLSNFTTGRVGNQELDTEKLFDTYYQTLEKSFGKAGPSQRESLEIIKIFIDKIKKTQKIKEFFNAESEIERDDDTIKQKFVKVFEEEFKIDKTTNEVKIMKKNDLMRLVSEVLNENTGQGYGKYPYHLNEPSEEEPDEDYMIEWNSLVDEVCGHTKKNYDGDPKTQEDMAVEVAKIFVKDTEIFREVLEMIGSNKSLGVEILQKIKKAKDKIGLDKELDV